MAKVSFDKSKQPSSEADTTVATADQPEPSQLPATQQDTGELSGEYNTSDMAIPRLNLGQKAGTLCDDNPDWLGKFIYDKDLCLGESIRIIFWRSHKYYQEDLEYGSTDIPRRYETIQEAREEGADVIDMCDFVLLIEASDAEQEGCSLVEHDGKHYPVAQYTVKKGAKRNTLGVLLRDINGWLKGSCRNGFYQLKAHKKTGQGNTWWVPVLKADGETSEALRKTAAEKLGG